MSIKTQVDSKKKPFAATRLVVYGDLTEMTLTIMGAKGMLDGKGAKRT